MNELIENVRLLDPVSQMDSIMNVWIENGIIKEITPHRPNIPSETTVIQGQGLILAPGLVDLYSHSGEPGYEDRETLASMTAAAVAGGFTRLGILPNTLPPIDNPGTLRWLQSHATNNSPHLYFWGALTQAGDKMTELAELAEAGIIGFTNGHPIENLSLLRRLLEYLKPIQKTVALMPVNSQLRGNGIMREGVLSIRCGLPGDSALSETVALATILELVAELSTPVHLMRISTARGVKLIAEAKAKGIPVTASTTWMHLLVNTETVSQTYDPNLKLDPPLGNLEDQAALIAGVKDGTIDAIAIDHSPYTYEEKTVAFGEAPSGAIGLEIALPLLWQRFVETQEWSALELWNALSSAPQHCLNQSPIACKVGEKAELVLFDPQQTWKVERQTLHSLSDNTFWLGKSLTGKVLRVWW